jgi:hypothetical protein
MLRIFVGVSVVTGPLLLVLGFTLSLFTAPTAMMVTGVVMVLAGAVGTAASRPR